MVPSMIAPGIIASAMLFIAEAPNQAASNVNSTERAIVQKTNAQREKYGLPPLQIDPTLMESAQRHCDWMAKHDSLQHTQNAVAENIAWGQESSSEVVSSWMNSRGHRANILDNGNHLIGVAYCRAADGRIYWCQQFSGARQ